METRKRMALAPVGCDERGDGNTAAAGLAIESSLTPKSYEGSKIV